MSNTRPSRFHFSLGQNMQEAGQKPASQAVPGSHAEENDQRIEHKMINGVDIRKTQPVYHENDMIVIEGSDNRLMSISKEKLAKGIAFVGGSGQGKSQVMYQCVNQIIAHMSADDKLVIVDSKGDYETLFRQQGNYLLGSSDFYQNVTDCWNIFAEINELDQLGRPEHRVREFSKAMELCRGFFDDSKESGGNMIFFQNAAAELMASAMCYMMWTAYTEGNVDTLCNYSLVHLLLEATAQTYIDMISQYPQELGSVRTYLSAGDGSVGEEGQGVLSTLNQMVRTLFMNKAFGDGDHTGVSIRQFINQHTTNLLFIELDLEYVNIQAPLIRVLCNLVLQSAMSKSRGPGAVYLVIDELALCGKINLLPTATNFGRDLGSGRTCTSIVGLQNINQLVAVYSQEEAKSLLNLGNLFAYANVDAETRDWVSKRLGKGYELVTYQHQTSQMFHRQTNIVNDWDLTRLLPGQAYVSISGEQPFAFNFAMYHPAST